MKQGVLDSRTPVTPGYAALIFPSEITYMVWQCLNLAGAHWPLDLLSGPQKFQLLEPGRLPEFCVINTTISLHLKGTKHMQFHILRDTTATDLSYFMSPP